jgi:hypothetical protein
LSEPELITAARDDQHYVVLLPAATEQVEQPAATLLQLEPAQLNRLLGFGLPLPAKRADTGVQAEQIKNSLRDLGIESLVVPAGDLNSAAPLRKVRALEFAEHSLTGSFVGTDARVQQDLGEIILVVTGRLISSRVELDERKRRGRKQTVDTRYLSADESVLDLYFRASESCWRIKASSFDFSCLGSARGFTAFENFTALIDYFRQRAPQALYDDSYSQARPILEIIWPLEPQTRTGEWRRSGAGKFDIATVTTTDNEDQFTKYSRLRYYLRKREYLR